MGELRSIEIDFEKGRITRHDAAWRILCTLADNSQQEFVPLCSELRFEVGDILKALAEDRRSTSNVRPTETQIELARRWLEEREESS